MNQRQLGCFIATATTQFKSRRPSGCNVIRVLHCVDINKCLWRDAWSGTRG